MFKLSKLREWLTVPEAAKQLSIFLVEEVTEANFLRLALEGQIQLSVRFVNPVLARCRKAVRYNNAQLKSAYQSGELPKDLTWFELEWDKDFEGGHLFPDWPHREGEQVMMLLNPRIDDERLLSFGNDEEYVDGVWDLPMVGAEKDEIERIYADLTEEPYVATQDPNNTFFEGCFVSRGDEFRQLIDADDEFSIYLPDDAVPVVRTKLLLEFEQSVNGVSNGPEKPISTSERNSLLSIIAALCNYSAIDPQGRGAASQIAKLTEELGAVVSPDTVGRCLKKAIFKKQCD